MPEGVGYGPQDTASVGLNLNVIGKHAYAYSGEKSVTNSLATLLSFTTGNFYSVMKYVPIYFTNHSEDFQYTVLLNGITILGQTLQDQDAQTFNSTELILPPYTLVEVKVICLDSATRTVGCLMTGQIYGKID
jgi:hypothetical protein